MAPELRAYDRAMVSVVVGVVLVLLGLALAVVGGLGLTGRLPRNRWAGVRTPGSLTSAESFTLVNRAAGPGVLTGGALVALGGIAVVGFDGLPGAVVAAVLAVGGLVVVGAAGALGARAATVPAPTLPHARCASCTGCELMDSVRP